MPPRLSAIERTLYSQLLAAVCEEMGGVLQRSAYSPNIRERCDFSCALFDGAGRMAAQGRNIPVHLGSMPASVAAALAAHRLEGGDVVLLNDPYHGGTHLPDLTVVAPWFPAGAGEAAAFLANRAHHADVGGMSGGSLPLSTELFQEGLIIPPVKVVRRGRLQQDIVDMLCANSRTPEDRRGDLLAQLAALRRGQERMTEAASQIGLSRLPEAFDALQRASLEAAAALVATLPDGPVSSQTALELPDGSSAAIRVELARRGGKLRVDLSASDQQHGGPFNAVRAVTLSAVYYVIRCLLPPEVPTTAGLLDAVEVVTRPGTIVDALPPAAVAAGNVETSQRIVEALLAALGQLMPGRIPAASQGTMNNLLVSGSSPAFTYYETIGGGHGGHPDGPGLSGRHSYMTNSLNTPVEALEHAYPMRIRRYALRHGSGGAGLHPGGEGLVREVEFLAAGEFTLLSQSQRSGPAGAAGGADGAMGRAMLEHPDLSSVELPGSCTVQVQSGDRLTIETPGGGGWGRPTPR